MDEKDLILEPEGEPEELRYCWAGDHEPRMIVGGDAEHAVLSSPPRPTRVLSLPSNNYQRHVRMDREMEPPRQDDPKVIQAAPVVQTRERNRREKWTDDEHKLFLMGYEEFGRKWTEVIQHYLPWKTQNQLASHAQKYFKRQAVPIENWIKHSVNNFKVDNLTREDYSRLAPHRHPPPAIASLPMSDGVLTPVQQPLHAAMQEADADRSSSSMLWPAHENVWLSGRDGGQALTWVQQTPSNLSFADAVPVQETVAGSHSSSHQQPFPHLGATQWEYQTPMFYPEVDPRMRMSQLAAATPEYNYPAPPMLWNNNMDFEPPMQHPSSDNMEGLLDHFTVPSDYRADYGINREGFY